MEPIFRIFALLISAIVICVFIKEAVPQLSAAVTILCIAAIALYGMSQIGESVSYLINIAEKNNISELVKPVLKILVITTVSKMLSEIASDSGERALGSTIEIFGGIVAAAIIMPLFLNVIRGIGGIA